MGLHRRLGPPRRHLAHPKHHISGLATKRHKRTNEFLFMCFLCLFVAPKSASSWTRKIDREKTMSRHAPPPWLSTFLPCKSPQFTPVHCGRYNANLWSVTLFQILLSHTISGF